MRRPCRNCPTPALRGVCHALRGGSWVSCRSFRTSHGFTRVRQRSSHIIMQRPGPPATTTVPVPDHATVRRGTLMSIIRQSGVSRLEFET
ncbi:MAG: type II toxin-antitoxin system HicA family toxin [Gemmataceae bacterium]|nr:type II toxin-antitoxin system HicA family toxin [Gemmataceae bacterium]